MKAIKGAMILAGAIFIIPVLYIIGSLVLTSIPINNQEELLEKNHSIYLNSNGVHLDVIISKLKLDKDLLDGLKYSENDHYLSFGYGERNFYLNTPNWSDLTLGNSFRALFLKNSTLIHLTRYSSIKDDWVEINIDQNQMSNINRYISQTFYLDTLNNKVLLANQGYANNDDFYEAKGRFSCFRTCNSWVNTGLKESHIKACLWTPFDFGLLYMHK